MKYLNLSSEITQIEVELEFLYNSMNHDIWFAYAALEGSWLHILPLWNKACMKLLNIKHRSLDM